MDGLYKLKMVGYNWLSAVQLCSIHSAFLFWFPLWYIATFVAIILEIQWRRHQCVHYRCILLLRWLLSRWICNNHRSFEAPEDEVKFQAKYRARIKCATYLSVLWSFMKVLKFTWSTVRVVCGSVESAFSCLYQDDDVNVWMAHSMLWKHRLLATYVQVPAFVLFVNLNSFTFSPLVRVDFDIL